MGQAANTIEWDIRRVEKTGSTNADLAQLAQQGAAAGIVLVADYQTHGRGRHSRKWEAPPGETLLFSMLLRPACGVTDFGWLTQLAGLSIADVCRDCTGVAARLKWPNDVLAQGQKLAGILAEAILGQAADPALVLGVGFNVNWPRTAAAEREPATAAAGQFRFPATSLLNLLGAQGATAPPPLDKMAVLDAFLDNFQFRLAQTAQPGWQESVRAEVRQRSATIGQKVVVELPAKSIAGTAVDISLTGALLLEPQGEPAEQSLEILAGDVIHASLSNPSQP